MDDSNVTKNELLNNLQLSFEANVGQKDTQIKFTARGQGYCAFFTPTGPMITPMRIKTDKSTTNEMEGSVEQLDYECSELKMKVEGACPNTKIVGEIKLEDSHNCFINKDGEKLTIDVPNYERIRYLEIYPGIDLIYFFKSLQLACKFIIKPGSDPGKINLRFRGADKVELDDGGNLLIQMRTGIMSLKKPKAYQSIDGEENEVKGSYVIMGRKNVCFCVGEYKNDIDLIIE